MLPAPSAGLRWLSSAFGLGLTQKSIDPSNKYRDLKSAYSDRDAKKAFFYYSARAVYYKNHVR